jgi:DNA repair photolyase
MVAPVLPWITDSADDLDALLGRIAAAGATGATVLPLHLRPGAREWYLGWIGRNRPDLSARYEALYAKGAYAAGWYRDRLTARVGPLLARHGLDRAGIRMVEGGRAVDGFPAGSLPDVAVATPATAVEQPALF